MKLAIMQPYLFPYIGYYQLINAVDTFVIYDNIQYIKGGWINRNRLRLNNEVQMFTIPLEKSSSSSEIKNREVLSNQHGEKNINKILRLINASYRKSPYFKEIYPLIEDCFYFQNKNLFHYVQNSITTTLKYLDLNINIIVSSSLDIDHSLKHQEKVIAICKCFKTKQYINSIGGYSIYDSDKFLSKNIEIKFLKVGNIKYKKNTISNLSIIDLLMNYSKNEIKNMLNNYELI